ncbi:Glycoprotein-N-acetylgalactosamine 3-beta-galactosyltransferase 1 [Cytospora mali]|uniref:N-acetylgalactosaminide beta-1,3-galactosyltransferase n=1 Tax=Cytospora mali TaxID=578113 RepID=A0A194V891_CYTMA|nr:Glycoprotein-N-acetylgalactosamine 3-beta-galactosyltransferase 1 [Valsa mali var. pyri (nom. inval.)]
MFPRVMGPRRLAGITTLVFLIWIIILWISLPFDSPILSWLRLATSKVFEVFRSPNDDERLLLEQPGRFPFADDEVAYIVKTGYGTLERVPALLEASRRIVKGSEYEDDNILVVGDFATEFDFQGKTVVIHDMVAAVMEHDAVVKTPIKSTERAYKYGNMTLAIKDGRKKDAEQYSKAVGWDLDALKFIPSLELAWKTMPGKKWYIMQDDDTFILRPSLYRFLEHLDPSKELYLGNAIGDYKARFAHGGSSFILSHAALRRLFDNPDVVSQAYVASLDETWGDKLIATTLIKVGVYISERYGHFFNGERPLITKASADRFCSPLVSFHGLAQPAEMKEVGKMFAGLDKPVFWRDLWEIYGEPSLDVMDKNPIRLGQDHVGRQDDPSMISRAESVDKCLASCESRGKECLAWTWDKESKLCILSPWVIVGEKPKDRYSGLNVAEVKGLAGKCGKY